MLAKRPQHRNWFNCTSRNLLQAGFFAGSKSQWDNFSLWLNQTDRPPGNWASPAHLEIIVRYLNWKIDHHCTLQAHLAIRMKRNYAKHPHFIRVYFPVCLLFGLFSPPILPGDNKVAAKYGVTKWRAQLRPELPCSRPGDSAHYLGLVLIEAGPGPSSDQWSYHHIANIALCCIPCFHLKNGLIAHIWWELLQSWWCNMICQCWQVLRVKLLMCTIMINSRKCNLNSSLNSDIIQEYSSKI